MAPVQLTEDQSDDIVYFARAGELSDLENTVDELSKSIPAAPAAVLAAAVDAQSGNTVLHMAAANGHDEIISYVLRTLGSSSSSSPPSDMADSSSIASSSTSESRPTPSSSSAASAASTSAHPLLNATNSSLNTPLHWAALNGHLSCVRLLADSGADLTLENASKHDALDEAERALRPDVITFLTARLSGKSEDEIREIEAKQKKEEAEAEAAANGNGDLGVKATQEDLEKLGLEDDQEGGVKVAVNGNGANEKADV